MCVRERERVRKKTTSERIITITSTKIREEIEKDRLKSRLIMKERKKEGKKERKKESKKEKVFGACHFYFSPSCTCWCTLLSQTIMIYKAKKQQVIQ